FLSVSDLDADGKIDLYISNNTSRNIGIFKNTSDNGTLSFSPRSNQLFGTYPRGMNYGDIDGDGMKDLAVVNYFDNTVSISKNLSVPGTISFAPGQNFETRVKPWDPTIHDFDGDGKPDMV